MCFVATNIDSDVGNNSSKNTNIGMAIFNLAIQFTNLFCCGSKVETQIPALVDGYSHWNTSFTI